MNWRLLARPAQLVGVAALCLRSPGASLVIHPAPPFRPPPRQAKPIVLPPMTGAPPKAIARLVGDSKVTFVVDDSGSMYGGYGDATGVRYAAAGSLIGLMRRSGGGTVTVIHWGTDAPAEMVTGPVDVKRARKDIERAMVIPPTLGGNDLPRALARAREVSDRSPEDIYYVITDGIEPVTPAVHAAVAALPADAVHMVLVDRGAGCNPEMEAAWKTVAFGSFTRLKTFDTKEMATQIAELYAKSLGLETTTRSERS